MTDCITEIKDMYKVAKQMVKMKDSLINQRLSVVPGPTSSKVDRSQTMKPAAAAHQNNRYNDNDDIQQSPPRQQTMKSNGLHVGSRA